MQKTYRAAAVTGLVGVCATGMSVLGAGSASAAPAAIPLDSCNTTVQANVGDSLTVTAKTVLAPQLAGLRATPVVGPPAADALGAALSWMKLGAFTVTQSASGGPANISGADIAKAVAAALPPLVPAALVTPIVTDNCAITVTKPAAVVTAAPQNAPQPAAANPPVSNVAAPTAVPAPSAPSYGSVPRNTYSDITSVPAGGAGFSVGVAPTMPPKSLTGYGLPSALGTAPTMAPQFGLLAAPPAAAAAIPAPTSAAAVLPMMSEVTALPAAPNTSTRVPAEAVMAALLLSLTTAALVRTWVLRRSSH
ncbi:MAG: hypothetical protein M3Y19_07140 [Actinomycetota bacterium]|nr:hypothetical protein [Actinomycetota bacterium]